MEKILEMDGEDEGALPGFRFHPTDEELVNFYLRRKVEHRPLAFQLISELDIYKFDPWELPKMASLGESQREWYFFCPRDRKYRNSPRPNRVTVSGFWKATGTDRPVCSIDGAKCIGLKKSLVFYEGKAARGVKTDWMMHEFRFPSPGDCPASFSKLNVETLQKQQIDLKESNWALCRIFNRKATGWKPMPPPLWEAWATGQRPPGSGAVMPGTAAPVLRPSSPSEVTMCSEEGGAKEVKREEAGEPMMGEMKLLSKSVVCSRKVEEEEDKKKALSTNKEEHERDEGEVYNDILPLPPSSSSSSWFFRESLLSPSAAAPPYFSGTGNSNNAFAGFPFHFSDLLPSPPSLYVPRPLAPLSLDSHVVAR